MSERQILFRGKALNRENTWFVGDLRRHKGTFWIFPLDEEPGIDKHKVDPATVGQYTGKDDKNGKKIFEGDKINIGLAHKGVIKDITNLGQMLDAMERGIYIEITGTIHDK